MAKVSRKNKTVTVDDGNGVTHTWFCRTLQDAKDKVKELKDNGTQRKGNGQG